ncbi:MAG: hypothetical protein SXV54_20585 [Chloroflexota bacterium]|nr:hypothetical protein [Chloroflexota bacterium]
MGMEFYVVRLPDDHPTAPGRYEVDIRGGPSFEQGGRSHAGPLGDFEEANWTALRLEAVESGVYEVTGGYDEWSGLPCRERSTEVDFGVWWRVPGSPYTWRVSWIQNTGELYARELAPDGNRFILLGAFLTREAVEARMTGWAEDKGDLEWLFPGLAALTDDSVQPVACTRCDERATWLVNGLPYCEQHGPERAAEFLESPEEPAISRFHHSAGFRRVGDKYVGL